MADNNPTPTTDRNRNYTDEELAAFVDELDDSERHGLVVAGLLPFDKLGDLDPALSGPDVARMMALAGEEDN